MPQTQSLLLTVAEVLELLGGDISRRSIWRWSASGQFPKPVRLGGRTCWKRSDIEKFIAEADGDLKKFNRIRRGEQ